MKSLPVLITGSVLFLLAGIVMVLRDIAGGFILIPIAVLLAIRAAFVARAR